MKKDNPLEKIRDQFIEGAGRVAGGLVGMLNRVCGQIYALLFLSREPLSLDDLVEQLKVSKGNVSINIRLLEDYHLVRKVWIRGSRRDYYEAVPEIPKTVILEFFEKILRNILDSLDTIKDCQDMAQNLEKCAGVDLEEARFVKDRLHLVRSFYEGANLLIDSIYSGKPLDTALLAPILKKTHPMND